MTEVPGVSPIAPQIQAQTAEASGAEARLFSYMAQMQAQSIVTGEGATLANPAQLGNELFRYLRGFVERSAAAEKVMAHQKQTAMGNGSSTDSEQKLGGLRFASLEADGSTIHRGPAHAPLDEVAGFERHATQAKDGEAKEKSLDEIVAEAKHSMAEIMTVMHFMTESTVVGQGSRKIVDNVNTLIKPQ